MNSSSQTTGLKTLWRVSYPMMLTYLSTMFMIFVDRLFLSWYSTQTFNAAVQAGTMGWGFLVGVATLVAMSEVFVAQYNGSGQFDKISKPVWQMAWVGLFSTVFFVLAGIWVSPLIYPPEVAPHAYDYFRYILYFGPAIILIHAFNGFYVGRATTKVIQWLTILGNVVNVILDPIFIFGWGPIPTMGAKGAAIATGIGSLVQLFVLISLFLSKKNHERYATRALSFDFPLIVRLCKIGLPPAVFVSLELLGWGIFYNLMARIGPTHIFVASVCQSILLLFLAFGMGLEKGVIALSGNFIGAGTINKIKGIVRASMIMIWSFTALTVLFLILFPDFIIRFFINDPAAFDLFTTGADFSTMIGEVTPLIKLCLVFVTFYILFENIRYVISGILTAAGDTLFLLLSGSLSLWFFLLVPAYVISYFPELSVSYSFFIWLVYSLVSLLIVVVRYSMNKWKSKTVIAESTPIPTSETQT
ncbi:MAG: hypothetical protein A3F09_05215 [Chlamydiae bacterium RIFCSPHIGHO2_12_FULL_49_11]|nr:MAG: hypothetical protein A3F09_05215 [Chlamydiae bacterium RIFCSPHIGHO2_12_FULL_49_11]